MPLTAAELPPNLVGAASPLRSFQEKLCYLVDMYARHSETHRDRYPRWPSFDQLAREISDRTGVAISHGYLHQLCRGKRDNPTLNHLQALAEFFGVPTSYFTDDAMTDEVKAQYELVLAMRDSRVREICTYAPKLDRRGLEAVTNLIKSLADQDEE